MLCVIGKFLTLYMVNRKQQLNALLLCLLNHLKRVIQLIGLTQGIADFLSLGLGKCVSHAASDNQGVNLVKEVVNHVNLIRNLCAAQDSHKGADRVLNRLS